MKRTIFAICFLSVLILLIPFQVQAATHTDTLSTYYPAPQGQYKNLAVSNNFTFAAGGTACTATTQGIALLSDGNGTLEYCTSTVPPTPLIQTAGGVSNLWNTNTSVTPNYLAPVTTGEPVVIGGGSPSNGSALTVASTTGTAMAVNGGMSLDGTTIMGVNNPNNPNRGYLTIGQGYSDPSYISGQLTVKGATTFLGYSDNFNGNFSVNDTTGNTHYFSVNNGDVGISGNSTIGASDDTNTTTINGNTAITPSSGGNLQVNGTQSLTVGTTTPVTITTPAIYICNSSGNCGYLAVNQGSDNNYYAVYAP